MKIEIGKGHVLRDSIIRVPKDDDFEVVGEGSMIDCQILFHPDSKTKVIRGDYRQAITGERR